MGRLGRIGLTQADSTHTWLHGCTAAPRCGGRGEESGRCRFETGTLSLWGSGWCCWRRWARPLALAILWAWVVLGQPLLFVLFFMTASVKSFSTAGGVAFIVLLSLSYLALPWLGIRFYQGKHVQGTFEAHDPGPSAVDARPVAILVLCLLDLFFLAALQVPLLFSGLFPLFGMLQSGMAGFYLVDASVLVLAVLLWGTWKRRGWALEGSAAYYLLLAAAWIATFARRTCRRLVL